MKKYGAWRETKDTVAIKIGDYIQLVPNESAFEIYDDLGSAFNKSTAFERNRKELLWARTTDKKLNPLPKTEWIPIADLDTDHIFAILKLGDIPPLYLKTLQQELDLRRSEERTKNLCGLNFSQEG